MTKTKSTKRALLVSALSLLLCVSMLIGTTYAWFTDSVTSMNNIIKSGNLDVELEYYDGDSWEKVTATTNVFEQNTLWEPGHTEVVYLKVSNLGTLALKYNLGVNIVDEIESINVDNKALRLSDYIEFGAIDGVETPYANREAARKAVTDAKILSTGYTKAGEMEAGEAAEYVALVVYMPETVGNEANYKTGEVAPQITLGLNLMATQFTSEEDSFDNQYDAAAEYAANTMLKDVAAVAAGETATVKLEGDGYVVINEGNAIGAKVAGDVTLDLNGKTLFVKFDDGDAHMSLFNIVKGGKLTVTGNGTIEVLSGKNESKVTAIFNNTSGTLVIENGTYKMDVKTYAEGSLIPTIIDNNGNAAGATTTINDGTFYHTRNMFRNFPSNNGITQLTINGGTFNGKEDDWAAIWNQKASASTNEGQSLITVNGGTFNYVEIDNEFNTGVTIADGVVVPVPVSNAAGLQTAIENATAGDTIALVNDVTVSDALTMNKSFTLDLNGKTLYMSTTDDSKISSAANVIIKNGNVDISGVNFTEYNGIFNITGGAANTLTVENVNFYGDGFTSYSVFWIAKASSGINTLNLIDSKFELKNEAYASGGFIKHPSGGENCSAINITNSVLDFENVTRLFLYGAYNIKDSEISFVDTTGEANGLRQGQFTIDNSKITISGGDKGISPRYADTVIKNGSVVTINNTKGNDVIFEYDFDVVVDSSSTFTYGTTSGTAGGQVIDN